jgi:hypothetical protein
VDWVGLTKLTPSGFADELAAFYRCDRVERRNLVGARFGGAQLSPRFLKEEHLFPYEHPSGRQMRRSAKFAKYVQSHKALVIDAQMWWTTRLHLKLQDCLDDGCLDERVRG